jgi:hypothetical protein
MTGPSAPAAYGRGGAIRGNSVIRLQPRARGRCRGNGGAGTRDAAPSGIRKCVRPVLRSDAVSALLGHPHDRYQRLLCEGILRARRRGGPGLRAGPELTRVSATPWWRKGSGRWSVASGQMPDGFPLSVVPDAPEPGGLRDSSDGYDAQHLGVAINILSFSLRRPGVTAAAQRQ